MSVIGSSSIGVMSNYVTAEGAYLKNAWRYLSLMLVTILLIPMIYLYDKQYLKYERYRAYIREMTDKGIQLDKKLNVKE